MTIYPFNFQNMAYSSQVRISPRKRLRIMQLDEGGYLIQFARLTDTPAEREEHGRVLYTMLNISREAAEALYSLLNEAFFHSTGTKLAWIQAMRTEKKDGTVDIQAEISGNSMDMAYLFVELAHRDRNGALGEVIKYAASKI